MSYISAIRQGEDVLVWERVNGERVIKTHRAPYYFYIKDKNGEHTSMYGDSLTRLDFDCSKEMYVARKQYEGTNVEMFESDIPVELKVLSEKYYNVAAPKLNISFLDIEVDYDPAIGFASISNPYAPINSVAIYHTHSNKYVVFAVPPNLAPHKATDDDYTFGEASEDFLKQMHEIAEFEDDIPLDIRFCINEKDLLMRLVEEIKDSDVISGWNSDFFDVPYIGRRLEMLGAKFLRMLSFEQGLKPKWREVEVMGNTNTTLDLSGRISADYMVLFKKYEMAMRPSYKLESIAEEMLPDLPKLEYEGSLATLYRSNFAWFVRYNLRDTEILKGLEDRLGYVDLANQMYHLSTGLYKHVPGTLKLAELATINYCHHELDGLIVNDVHVPSESGSIQGAFVLLPQEGMHENISSVDIASLYPSAIRAINISPETIIGQLQATEYEKLNEMELDAWNKCPEKDKEGITFEMALDKKNSLEGYASDLIARNEDEPLIFRREDGEEIAATAKTLRKVFKEMNWAVSGYGTVFTQNKQGIIPMILSDWYAQRKKYKREMAKAKDAGEKIKTTYYDKLQYVYKIKLNSFYGALTNKYFRFYDLRMGESTTGTGRKILLHQCAKACEILDGEYAKVNVINFEPRSVGGPKIPRWHYGFEDKPENGEPRSVVYGDTDSSYFVTHAKDADEATVIGNAVAKKINESFQEFMQRNFLCTPGFDDIISCEREVVSDRGIFVDKKRYILHLVDLDGWKCDKMKVMGLDTKKTTLPKEVSAKLNGFVERFLKGAEWTTIAEDIVEYKDELTNANDVMTIGLPKGVNGVEDYTEAFKQDPTCRLPGHVAASILYNACLEKYEDTESLQISSGMKIKVFYLATKVGKFKAIAIPVDIEQVPAWFLRDFKINKQMHIKRLVDNPLNNIIKAIGKVTPTRQELMVDSLLGF